jgi:hypothetical protein
MQALQTLREDLQLLGQVVRFSDKPPESDGSHRAQDLVRCLHAPTSCDEKGHSHLPGHAAQVESLWPLLEQTAAMTRGSGNGGGLMMETELLDQYFGVMKNLILCVRPLIAPKLNSLLQMVGDQVLVHRMTK